MNIIRVTLTKSFKATHGANSEYYYHKALEDFIYTVGGCITGWEKKSIYDNEAILAYTCTTEYRERDAAYLKNVWAKNLENNFDVEITDELNLTGEMIIDFGE